MANHVKPTTEELEASAEKALEEVEAMEAEATKETAEEIPEFTEEVVEETTEEVVEEEVSEEEPEDEVVEEVKKQPKEEPIVDEKVEEKLEKTTKKLKNSSAESLVLYERNKQMADAIDKASEVSAPTTEDMQKEYSDWDIMSDFEKKMATDNEWNKKKLGTISDATSKFKDFEKWQSNVELFLEDPTNLANNPELEGKEDEFRLYALKPTKRGVDFDTLVGSFLYTASKNAPAKNKGAMFEKGTSGSSHKSKPKSDKITVEQARILRKTNYSQYKKYLTAGKIESVI